MTSNVVHLWQFPTHGLRCASFRFLFSDVGFVALAVVFAWPACAAAADEEDPNKPPYHVEHVSSPSHEKNVTWPPKESVWPPERKKKVVKVERVEGKKKVVEEKEVEGDWPSPEEHKKVHTFPNHYKDWTWPRFSPNGSSENGGAGWAPHLFKTSWPPYHLQGYTWPPHDPDLTWYPEKTINPPVKDKKGKYPPSTDHRQHHTFSPHIKDKTFPEHCTDVTWEVDKGPYIEPLESPKQGRQPKLGNEPETGKAEPPSEKQPFTPLMIVRWLFWRVSRRYSSPAKLLPKSLCW
jgi:hypothetical protein